jgi:hypothetical protein
MTCESSLSSHRAGLEGFHSRQSQQHHVSLTLGHTWYTNSGYPTGYTHDTGGSLVLARCSLLEGASCWSSPRFGVNVIDLGLCWPFFADRSWNHASAGQQSGCRWSLRLGGQHCSDQGGCTKLSMLRWSCQRRLLWAL